MNGLQCRMLVQEYSLCICRIEQLKTDRSFLGMTVLSSEQKKAGRHNPVFLVFLDSLDIFGQGSSPIACLLPSNSPLTVRKSCQRLSASSVCLRLDLRSYSFRRAHKLPFRRWLQWNSNSAYFRPLRVRCYSVRESVSSCASRPVGTAAAY